MKLGILYSRVRKEEKMIFQAAEKNGVEIIKINDEDLILNTKQSSCPKVDLVLDRSLAHLRAEVTLKILENWGIKTVNSYQAAVTCDNKILTDIALTQAHIPTPTTLIAYTPESALQAIEQIGYPVVLKPFMGSWGRLLAKIKDREAAEALIEHKSTLGSMHHSIFYIQEYVDKNTVRQYFSASRQRDCRMMRDIRVFVIGDKVVAAMYRHAEHWITNTARGGFPLECEITSELEELAMKASQAVGAEIAGVDIVESCEGLKVIEINVGAEFHGLIETTDVDIASEIIKYCKKIA